MGSGFAYQDVQASLPPEVGLRSISKAAAQVVARAGCGLAQTCIPWRGAQTGVTRTDRLGIAYQCPERGEGDLIGGSKNSYIATLVERYSRYVMLVKLANKDTESVVTALIKSAQKLPRELYKSLTWDCGKELTDHPRFTLATDVDVYFCDPQSPLSADC